MKHAIFGLVVILKFDMDLKINKSIMETLQVRENLQKNNIM